MRKILLIIILLPLAVYLILLTKESNWIVHEMEPKKNNANQLASPLANIKKISYQQDILKREVNIKKSNSAIKSKQVPDDSSSVEVLIKKLKESKVLQVKVVDGMAIAFGDIVMGNVDNTDEGESSATGVVEPVALNFWESNRVHYVIDPEIADKKEIEMALEIINKSTVMELVPWDGQFEDAIIFKRSKEHCYSYLGKVGGLQPIFLSPECKVTEILHELLHAFGLIHEQSRLDRDDFVDILWNNILPEFYSQFQYIPESYMASVEGTGFDYSSIMLYRPNFFSKKSDLPTMRSKTRSKINPSIGRLSKLDVERLYRIYGK